MSRGDKRHPAFFWNAQTVESQFTAAAPGGAGTAVTPVPAGATGALFSVGQTVADTVWLSTDGSDARGVAISTEANERPRSLYVGLDGTTLLMRLKGNTALQTVTVNVLWFF